MISVPIHSMGDSSRMNLWYVIQTKPKKEEEVKAFLSFKGLEIFNPLIETLSFRKGNLDRRLTPLFPGYIFGNFDLKLNYALVKWASGVKTIIGIDGAPSPIPEEIVELIKARVGRDGLVKKNRRLELNDPVRINSGPLRDLTGIFEGWVPERDRVKVLLNLIGYQPRVELHYAMVERI